MRPDIDKMREHYLQGAYIASGHPGVIMKLLAYIDELERRLKEIGAQVDELREQYDSVLEANVQAMDGRPWRCCK